VAQHPKRLMFAHFAATAQALASPARIEIIDLLIQGERSVESVAGATPLSVANASHHLQRLHRAGLLRRRRAGKEVLYDIADEGVVALYRELGRFTDRHSADAQITRTNLYSSRDPEPALSPEALLERLSTDPPIMLDVRPALEYVAGHLPGAISMPVELLATRHAELPAEGDVVTYCRGPQCVYAYQAIERLRPAGRRAIRLEGGFMEWRYRGLPIERGTAVPCSPGSLTLREV
jgi:rhodanese-related sulfurtransferase/DNA-binding transcriptional ArsR family regulator